jgi:DNA-binding transcriptional LysR family regulator
MYPLGLLIGELETARTRLRNVFEGPDGTLIGEAKISLSIAVQTPKPCTITSRLLPQKGGFPLRVAQSVSNLTAMIALVAGGVGVAYVPESLRNMTVPWYVFGR